MNASPEVVVEDSDLPHLHQAHLDQAKAYGTAVLLVAGAALSLSATMFTKLGAGGNAHFVGLGWLKASWIALALTMVAEVSAILASMHTLSTIIGTRRYGTRWGILTNTLNWVMAVSLIVGLSSLVAFAFQNV